MTLKELALLSGVCVERCDKEWGGTWAYKTTDYPNSTMCGYRTESALYKAWAEDAFGKTAFKALAKLLEDTQQPAPEDAIAHERERCAALCNNLVIDHPGRADLTAQQCADAIRRGEQ